MDATNTAMMTETTTNGEEISMAQAPCIFRLSNRLAELPFSRGWALYRKMIARLRALVDNLPIVDRNSGLLLELGHEARRGRRLDDAKRLFSEAAALCRSEGDLSGLAQALAGLGQIERDLQDGAAAREHYEEAVAVCRTLNDDLRLAHTIRHLGDVLREQDEHALAASCYSEALEIYRKNDGSGLLDLANTIRGFALLKSDNGETHEALALWLEAKEIYAKIKLQDGVTESDRYLSLLARA
jgi:tetratricopeptide (TPR) repeat protein